MSISFRAYNDSALTQEITSANPLTFTHVVGASDYQDKIAYIGSTTADMKLQMVSDPGTDPVVVSVTDSDSGSGAPASEIKLALSSGGLAAATPGASLELSATLYSEVANAVAVHIRRTSALNVANAYTDISLHIDGVVESPV